MKSNHNFITRVKEQIRCTYVYFFPLRDVANETGQAQQPDQREQLGETQDAQSASRV